MTMTGILPCFPYLKRLIASAFFAYYAEINSSGLGVGNYESRH
jgi:hypothetical protein